MEENNELRDSQRIYTITQKYNDMSHSKTQV